MDFNNRLVQQLILLAVSSGMIGYCSAELDVAQPWVKLAPPFATANAAYMQFTNPQQQPQIITNVSSDCCAMVMFHQTTYEQDRVSMDHLAELIIPPQTAIELKPGGIHIMLMQAYKPLVINDTIVITLRFSDGAEQKIHAVVRADRHE